MDKMPALLWILEELILVAFISEKPKKLLIIACQHWDFNISQFTHDDNGNGNDDDFYTEDRTKVFVRRIAYNTFNISQ